MWQSPRRVLKVPLSCLETAPDEQILAPSCLGVPSERQLTHRNVCVRRRCCFHSQCTGNHSDQHEYSLQQPQKHPAESENAAIPPELSPQLQILQKAVLTFQLRRTWALSSIPIPDALCATFLALLLPLPIQQPSLGGCSYTGGKHISFCWALTSFVTIFPVTQLWYIISTANSHCYF